MEPEDDGKELFNGTDDNSTPAKNDNERVITVVAFFSFGFILYSVASLLIAAAEDILRGSDIPTSAVLSCIIGPYVLITLVSPYFAQNIPYLPRVIVVFILYEVGLFSLVYVTRVEAKLLSVCLMSFAFGVGEMSSIAMTSFFNQVVVGVFSAGTGVGFITAPLYYTAMTTWFCVSSETTTLTVAGLVVLYLLFYALMERKHSDTCTTSRKPQHETFNYIQYERVEETTSEQDSPSPPLLTTAEKLQAIKQILPTILCVVISWISEYLVTQGVITTYAFPNSPFPPRDYYQYYITLFLMGEFIGRSYLALVSLISQNSLPK
ncbi:battenin CLN3 protein [Desmophyllum pertusum]|uniref:Battenin n=1 Tax=Desmophyllum pertusum TaxID=174260 RepID=A0A9X0CMW8_9CNID|nr:battenin CLN3 protein [Desmophyllum pertusum]